MPSHEFTDVPCHTDERMDALLRRLRRPDGLGFYERTALEAELQALLDEPHKVSNGRHKHP